MGDKNIQAIYPLTPIQEGILFHCIKSPTTNIYVTQYSCKMQGAIELGKLREAWNIVVDRHAALRTLFTWEKRDQPLQIVRRRVDLPFAVSDWRNVDELTQTARLEKVLRDDRTEGFGLDVAPLMRLHILQLGDRKIHLIWTFHHIVIDGWSRRLVFDEVLETYCTLLRGNEPNRSLAPDFSDFVNWQQNQDHAAENLFWKQRLDGFTTPSLPEIVLPDESDDETALPGQFSNLTLSRSLSSHLKALARRSRCTLNIVIAAAWSILLSRYCDSRDIVFGTTVSGRSAQVSDIECMVGLFINTLPVRIKFDEETTLEELFDQVRSQQVEQQSFEHSSLQAIHRGSGIHSSTPVFSTILVFENAPGSPETERNDLVVTAERIYEFSNFPFAMLVVPKDCIQLIAVHDAAHYSRYAVNELMRSFEYVLQQFIAEPQPRLSAITALPVDNQCRILRDWNETARSHNDSVASVSQMFEQRAAECPTELAITTQDTSVTYAELNRRANRLARLMLRHAPVSGLPVILYVERSIEAIVCMLASLKVGAVYVPLDTSDPSSRLECVISDLTKAFCNGHTSYKPLLLTHSNQHEESIFCGATVLCLEEVQADSDDTNVDIELDSNDLAYIIYTSGSTGAPKGVMVPNRALINSTMARNDFYASSPRNFALLSPLSTDSALAGIYWTLCSGGNLILPGRKAELDVGQLSVLFHTHEITHTLCVPSLYELILEHAASSAFSELRVVIVAGEACSPRLAITHKRELPHAQLFNEYGPSEACVWASASELDSVDITIGKPISNTQLYVLDSAMRPVPIGVAGELYIGGANVASGYVGNEQDTVNVFVPDPYGEKARKLYKTGDRVRYRADGNLEFLGRIDNQIKVRGYRVEPSEIEVALTSHTAIDSAVVFIERPIENDDLEHLLESVAADTIVEMLESIEDMDDYAVDQELIDMGQSTGKGML